MAAAALVVAAFESGIGDAYAAPSTHCSQVYFRAQAQCRKSANSDSCARTIGDRMSVCLKTGCWHGVRLNRCGFVRL